MAATSSSVVGQLRNSGRDAEQDPQAGRDERDGEPLGAGEAEDPLVVDADAVGEEPADAVPDAEDAADGAGPQQAAGETRRAAG